MLILPMCTVLFMHDTCDLSFGSLKLHSPGPQGALQLGLEID